MRAEGWMLDRDGGWGGGGEGVEVESQERDVTLPRVLLPCWERLPAGVDYNNKKMPTVSFSLFLFWRA